MHIDEIENCAGSQAGDMHEWSKRMLLRHYLQEGVTKTELARRFGCESAHDSLLDRVRAAGPGPGPRPESLPPGERSWQASWIPTRASLKRGCESSEALGTAAVRRGAGSRL